MERCQGPRTSKAVKRDDKEDGCGQPLKTVKQGLVRSALGFSPCFIR